MRRVCFRQDIADVALTSRVKLARRLKAIKTTSDASASVLQQPDVSNTSFHQEGNENVSETSGRFEFMLLLAQEYLI